MGGAFAALFKKLSEQGKKLEEVKVSTETKLEEVKATSEETSKSVDGRMTKVVDEIRATSDQRLIDAVTAASLAGEARGFEKGKASAIDALALTAAVASAPAAAAIPVPPAVPPGPGAPPPAGAAAETAPS